MAYQGPKIIPAGALTKPAAAAAVPVNPILLNPFALVRAAIKTVPLPPVPVTKPPVPKTAITSGSAPSQPTPGPILNPTQQNVAASGPIYNPNGQPVGAVAPPSDASLAVPDSSGGTAVTASATFPLWGWALLALGGAYLLTRGGA